MTRLNVVVERRYEPDKALCTRAVESLLKSKAAEPRQAGRFEDEKDVSRNDSLAHPQYIRT